ncbi:hypothetical protein AOQ84DRAFT_191379 [Glonium stellatum]|uniref:Oxidoreductase-like protein n=1 Tax=Glonium stellatum TaxID=574774 RepID=A0A8E2F7G6_9PEZI|nr:hypothetical protein AOQ84DRAFT_191379 [Glonium stellatum]
MASDVVEARSLSSLTSLASNPPRYPRNPTHKKHEPLVLYIARVPGSRDVFLTPIKPRQKVVTAEDVQSSLYYLHINQPEDARLLDPPNVGHGSGEGNVLNVEPPRLPLIPRKALRSAPSQYDNSMLTPDNPTLYPTASSNFSIMSNGKSTELQPLSPRNDIQFKQNAGTPNYLPRPVSPFTVDHQRGQSAEIARFRKENVSPALPPRRRSELPKLPPKPSPGGDSLPNYDSFPRVQQRTPRDPLGDRFSPTPNPTNTFHERHGSSSPRRGRLQPLDPDQTGNLAPLGISLTLIRRDPASSAQWNVATIEDPPVFESSSAPQSHSAVQKTKKLGAPLYIKISNPGYYKFLHHSEDITSLLSRGGGVSESAVRALDKNKMFLEPNQSGYEDTIFRRRLWMEGSKLTDGGFERRRMNSSDSNFGLEVPRSSSGSRSKDRVLGGFNNPTTSIQSWDSQSSEKRASVFRGYEFLSPWNGRCEFSTGGGGRSLKCKHILPDGLPGTTSSAPTSISELRFNLPGSSIFTGSSSPKPDEPSTKRSSFLNRPRNYQMNSFASDSGLDETRGFSEELERLDLSLGQESAGGGFGGKQAKLGKLIIEDEGLKMIDLLVAANLALWWRVYEKVDRKSRANRTSFQA